jgi:YNFM family putative membrane transporter
MPTHTAETKPSLPLNKDLFLPGSLHFWRASIALTIASFLTFANIYLTQPLLPAFTHHFNISPTVSSLSLSLTILSLAVGLFLFGPLSDAVGRKPIMTWTMGLSVIPTLLIPFVDSFSALLVLRMLQGFLLAGLPSIAMAYLGEEFSPKALGLAVGLYISGNTIGGMSGRIISGILTDLYTWKASFVAFGMISGLGVIAFYYLLPSSGHFNIKPLRLKQAVFKMVSLLANRHLLQAYMIAFLMTFSFVGLFNYVTFLLSGEPYSFSSTMLGWLFLTYLSGTFSSTLSGRITDRLGAKVTIVLGITVALIGAGLMLNPSQVWIITGLLIVCFGFFAAHASASAWVNQYATESKASVTGLYLIFYYMGGGIGSTALGFLWKAWGWPGVVTGTLIVMTIALGFGLRLKQN